MNHIYLNQSVMYSEGAAAVEDKAVFSLCTSASLELARPGGAGVGCAHAEAHRGGRKGAQQPGQTPGRRAPSPEQAAL